MDMSSMVLAMGVEAHSEFCSGFLDCDRDGPSETNRTMKIMIIGCACLG